jgi:hypothetical protein
LHPGIQAQVDEATQVKAVTVQEAITGIRFAAPHLLEQALGFCRVGGKRVHGSSLPS